jgi:osmotically-inducible protein OsmY
MRSDSDIKRDVEEELKWEPNVDATDIAVAVKKWRCDIDRLRSKLRS